MKYLLRKDVIDQVPEIPISEANYAACQEARQVLLEGFAVEEKYEVLISSYLAFEKQILNASASNMVRDYVDYYDFFEVRLGLNICMIDLLTSARMYVDQLGRHVRGCLSGGDDAEGAVKALFSAEYEAHTEYRLMEALRNHVQHHGLPVHDLSSGSHWTSLEADGLLEFSLEVAVVRSFLAENDKFNATVLAEMPRRVDLKAATRRYLDSLSTVQASVRSLIKGSMDQARRTLEDAHRRYGEVYKESLVGLSACKCDDEKCTETVPLLLDWDDIRIKLQKKNSRLINLAKRYVSGKSCDEKP